MGVRGERCHLRVARSDQRVAREIISWQSVSALASFFYELSLRVHLWTRKGRRTTWDSRKVIHVSWGRERDKRKGGGGEGVRPPIPWLVRVSSKDERTARSYERCVHSPEMGSTLLPTQFQQ